MYKLSGDNPGSNTNTARVPFLHFTRVILKKTHKLYKIHNITTLIEHRNADTSAFQN
ncbi:hypothetical protein McpAg1_17710 [Methanocorpusculaceae archaeon Ag1]|uniref:Uncharacterized protein n=1 Tax=Methanorbis furvi TaxID=3028299 RepID=A0AAE4MDY3_9EURY|nr:hypothetical protein [Methanocorpusculaceae archaeon Ag1]